MFLRYFNLQEQPFGVTPDPRFLYMSRAHREALSSLIYGIESERGFLAMIAPPGMGKTTLLFQLLERLRNQARTAFLFNTQCDSKQLLGHLLTDLGVDFNGADMVKVHEQLNAILLRSNRDGKRCVFIIDEAQNLDYSVLETVRLLSNFETPRSKLLQIVVAGQPALAETLADPKLLQFRQRIGLVARLRALNRKETAKYVRHRLRVAGRQNDDLFTPEALNEIARRSEGVPRLINSLCFNALSLAYALDQPQIGADTVVDASRDLNFLADWTEPSYEANEDEGETGCDVAEPSTQAAVPVAFVPDTSNPAPTMQDDRLLQTEPGSRTAEPCAPAALEPAAGEVERTPEQVQAVPEGASTLASNLVSSSGEAPGVEVEPEVASGFWRRVAAAMTRMEFRAAVAVGAFGTLLAMAPAPSRTEAQPVEAAGKVIEPDESASRSESERLPTTEAGSEDAVKVASGVTSQQRTRGFPRQRPPAVVIRRGELKSDNAVSIPAIPLLPGDFRTLHWFTAIQPAMPRLTLQHDGSALAADRENPAPAEE